MKRVAPPQSRLQIAIIVLALLGAVWYLAGLVAVLVSAPPTFLSAEEPLRPLPQPARFNWFATESAATPVQPVATDQELLNASINAELLGVIIQGGQALASIQLPRSPNGVYRVGDEISPGVILEQIEPFRVVVSERGTRRQIPLKPIVGSIRTSTSPQLLQTVEQPSAGFSLAGVMGATPIQVAGHGLAIRLDSLDPEIEQISDLRVRDVILSVDGSPVAELMTNPLRWQQLMQQSTVGLNIQRDGVDQQITVNARSLGERILPSIGQGLVQ